MKNILIIKTGSIGDVLRTTCVLEGIKEKYFNPRVYWLTSIKSVSVLENNHFLNEVYVMEYLNKDIYKKKFDLVISLEEDSKTLDILSKLKTRTIFGIYKKEGNITYTPKSSYWYDMSLISKFGKSVADSLKKTNLLSYPEILYRMLDLKWRKQRPILFLKEGIKEYSLKKIEKNFSQDKLIIGVVIGAGGRWPLKVLPFDLQIKLINKIRKELGNKVEILLITGPSELELESTNEIKKKLPFVKTHEIVNLDSLFGIINICDIVVTPDTLSMHIAISLDKYVVAYFTVTSVHEIEIYSGEKVYNEKDEYYCSYSAANPKRPNPTDKIDLDSILKSIKKVASGN